MFIHGKGTVVSLDAKDLSAYGTSCEYELKADEHDVTTFGNDFKIFNGGLIESSMKMEGNYDDTETNGPRAVLESLVGKTSELIYQPEGTAAGAPVRTWEVLLTTYTETAPVNDMIKFAAEFRGAGPVEVTTVGP
jgi:hypothetical protein